MKYNPHFLQLRSVLKRAKPVLQIFPEMGETDINLPDFYHSAEGGAWFSAVGKRIGEKNIPGSNLLQAT